MGIDSALKTNKQTDQTVYTGFMEHALLPACAPAYCTHHSPHCRASHRTPAYTLPARRTRTCRTPAPTPRVCAFCPPTTCLTWHRAARCYTYAPLPLLTPTCAHRRTRCLPRALLPHLHSPMPSHLPPPTPLPAIPHPLPPAFACPSCPRFVLLGWDCPVVNPFGATERGGGRSRRGRAAAGGGVAWAHTIPPFQLAIQRPAPALPPAIQNDTDGWRYGDISAPSDHDAGRTDARRHAILGEIQAILLRGPLPLRILWTPDQVLCLPLIPTCRYGRRVSVSGSLSLSNGAKHKGRTSQLYVT